MGEQLSRETAPPEPDIAATEPSLPTTGAPQQPPVQSGRASRPQPEEDAGAPPPPPAEAQGRETEDGVGAPLEEGPGSEDQSSNSRRLSLRPVCCTVYCVESDWRPEPPPESPLPPDGEGGKPRSTAIPQPSLRGGGKGGGGSIEVDLYLLPEPFSGLISGDFGSLLVLTCRVCLEEKPLKPLPCCKKPVCEDCLKRYLSSQIQCPTCQFVWCFKCHSPWHEGVNCKEYKKGDKLLRHWANEIEHGQRNAQKCPKCKIHIQRTEGCDHMTCSQCNTNFCYRCGERYRQLRFFGDHTSNLSIFGCKYRYLPERPHLRRLVRGSVCGGKLLITPLILVLGLVMGAIAVIIGLFVFPIYCLCKKKRKRLQTEMPWNE
ncbi:E3 ubiquitin-protein ligase RNF217 isoform X2 [Heteronotia binoei]|uniref:E3 ubiquitin-protein ligase RNF217 isoform X2 n=1 Tax=Heteronotia binoei TaxID=13085 RepID=UPI002930909E|nr:E3 ubiquitin-protein ligase RNF217 isoform X2 [Heteronotia binoei]